MSREVIESDACRVNAQWEALSHWMLFRQTKGVSREVMDSDLFRVFAWRKMLSHWMPISKTKGVSREVKDPDASRECAQWKVLSPWTSTSNGNNGRYSPSSISTNSYPAFLFCIQHTHQATLLWHNQVPTFIKLPCSGAIDS